MTIDYNSVSAQAESSSAATRRQSTSSTAVMKDSFAPASTVTPQQPEKKVSTRKDPYYGHEETARMSSRFIRATFLCPDIPPPTSPATVQPTLAHFIAYALYRTRLPHFVTIVALVYLQRLKARYPSAKGSSGHRLFISAFMIASKMVCDDTYSNQSWCVVGQKMFALKEMNQMEREMCGYLDWQLNAAAEEVEDFESKISKEHSNTAVFARRQAAIMATQQVSVPASPRPLSPSSDSRKTAPLPSKRPKVVGRMESTASVIPVMSSESNVAAAPATSYAPPPRVASVPSLSTFAPNIDVSRKSTNASLASRAFQATTNVGSMLTASRPTTRRTASSIGSSATRKTPFPTGFEHIARQQTRRAGLSGGSNSADDMVKSSQLVSTLQNAMSSDDDMTSSTHSSPDSQLCQTPETALVHPIDTVSRNPKLGRNCSTTAQLETEYGPYSVYGCSDMPIKV
ncbi:hypothetical protein QFC21_003946 [Naganishia friedmannii]|uniref:Uncharacterized protein n=1 Tax=Naganishia friedmannii TaxID=89922 RepID=A0ACC2VKJ8_9TREE|nr:hypothetical protein QFC21_003946 [Naganishia friedmannii]